MKIALIAKRLSNSLGGAERVAATLAQTFASAGSEVHIFTGSSDLTIDGVHIREIKVLKWLSPLRLLSFQRKVSHELRRERYDIIYSLCQVYPLDIYRVGDGIHRHWMKLQYPNPLHRGLTYATSLVHPVMVWLEGRIMSRGKFFIANSRLVRDQLISYYGVREDKIRVIYNGVNHEVFSPDVRKWRQEMRDRFHIPERDLVLLFASNNWERKGLSTIMEAMAQGGSVSMRLIVVGRGDERPYRKLAEKLGLAPASIVFTGRTSEIERFYGMADIFILPTHYEPFSNVCLEAMACGLPVITTKGNGASELVREGENGFVLQTWRDSGRLAVILGMLADDALRKKIGDAALLTAGEYTWKRHVAETMEVFRKLTGSTK